MKHNGTKKQSQTKTRQRQWDDLTMTSPIPSYLQDTPLWVQEIQLFWFGHQNVYEDEYKHLFKRWYRGGPRLDAEILERFDARLQEVAAAHETGDFASWSSSERTDMALVILLDQMSRNMYRGDAKMFATDDIAQELVLRMLEDGRYESLAHIERLFCCVALEHAEDLQRVTLSQQLMQALATTAPEPQRQRFISMCRYNRQHLDIIAAFGRYPHRNHLLNRETTAEEEAFLKEKNYRFMRSVNKGYK